ncbi:hypothetical protein BaRGS_00035631, partial [Batillaria attramentaria]
ARKQVNYSKFETDLDDDFADPSPPPPKKLKKTDKNESLKDERKTLTSTQKTSSRNSRVPLDDKLYERDLQSALELSLVSSQPQVTQAESCQVKSEPPTSHGPVLHSTPLSPDETAPEIPTSKRDDQKSPTILPSAIFCGVADDDGIEFLGTVSCSGESLPNKRRSTASKKKTVYTVDEDSEDDFSANEPSSDSESEYDQNDSDFDDTHATNPPPAAGIPLATSKTSITQSSVRPTAVTNSATPSPVSRPPTDVVSKRPAWTPPARAGGGSPSVGASSLKSPSSGLRLGLSRHARVKPLHPSLKVT